MLSRHEIHLSRDVAKVFYTRLNFLTHKQKACPFIQVIRKLITLTVVFELSFFEIQKIFYSICLETFGVIIHI